MSPLGVELVALNINNTEQLLIRFGTEGKDVSLLFVQELTGATQPGKTIISSPTFDTDPDQPDPTLTGYRKIYTGNKAISLVQAMAFANRIYDIPGHLWSRSPFDDKKEWVPTYVIEAAEAYVGDPFTSLSPISSGFIGSTYSGGFNTRIISSELTTLYTGPAATLQVENFRDNTCTWGRVELSDSVYSWTDATLVKLEAIIDAMHVEDVKPILIVGVDNNSLHASERPWDVVAPVHYQNYLTFVATHLGPKCNDYDIYNKPESSLTAGQYAQMLRNSFSSLKAGNAACKVWANALDPATNSTYQNALIAAGGLDYADGYLFHSYESGTTSGTKTPEYVRNQAAAAMANVRATYPNMRFGIGESGWERDVVGADQAGRNLSRLIFMFRALGVDTHCIYSLFDYDAVYAGLYSNGTTQNANAPYVQHSMNICEEARQANYFRQLPVHGVAMLRPNGNRRFAFWGSNSTGLVGDTAASTDASGTLEIAITNAGAPDGILTRTSMADGSTTTQNLAAGTQIYEVAYGPIPAVLSSSRMLTFEEWPVG